MAERGIPTPCPLTWHHALAQAQNREGEFFMHFFRRLAVEKSAKIEGPPQLFCAFFRLSSGEKTTF